MSRVSAADVKFKPTIPPQTRCRKSVVTPSATCTTTTATSTQSSRGTADDEELLAIATQMEKDLGNYTNDSFVYCLLVVDS